MFDSTKKTALDAFCPCEAGYILSLIEYNDSLRTMGSYRLLVTA